VLRARREPLTLQATGIHATGSETSTEAPEIGFNEIKLLEEVGKGNFGRVFRGNCRGKIVAVKQLFAKDLESKMLEEFRKEIAVLTCVPCPCALPSLRRRAPWPVCGAGCGMC